MVSKQVRMPTRLLKALENGQFGQQPDAITPSAKKNEKGKKAWDGGQITRCTAWKAGTPIVVYQPIRRVFAFDVRTRLQGPSWSCLTLVSYFAPPWSTRVARSCRRCSRLQLLFLLFPCRHCLQPDRHSLFFCSFLLSSILELGQDSGSDVKTSSAISTDWYCVVALRPNIPRCLPSKLPARHK